MNKISAALISYNEAKYIARAITSLDFVDEIVIIDNGSTDGTQAIAKSLGATVIHHEWMGYGAQRQISLAHTTHDWVVVLDCDEAISFSLKEEIKATLQNPSYFVYKIPRLNYFFGKAIRHAGQYPDYQIRLFHKQYAHYDDARVHEGVNTKQKIGTLKHNIEHLAYESLEQFIAKQNKYAALSKKKSLLKALINPYWTFFKIYILKRGFLEGKRGFIIAKVYAAYTFWKYIK